MAPEGLARVTGGEVEADAIGQFADAASDLKEAQAEGVEWEVGGLRPSEPAAQDVEEPIGANRRRGGAAGGSGWPRSDGR